MSQFITEFLKCRRPVHYHKVILQTDLVDRRNSSQEQNNNDDNLYSLTLQQTQGMLICRIVCNYIMLVLQVVSASTRLLLRKHVGMEINDRTVPDEEIPCGASNALNDTKNAPLITEETNLSPDPIAPHSKWDAFTQQQG